MFSREDKGYVVCKACLEENAPQDENCHICGSPLDVITDADEIFGIYPEEMYTHTADDDPLGVFSRQLDEGDTLVRLSSRMCIACDAPMHECGCGEEYMPFDEVLVEIIEDGIDIYDQTSVCDMCVFTHTPGCEPLRGWMRTWLEDRDKPSYDQLNGCENYRSY